MGQRASGRAPAASNPVATFPPSTHIVPRVKLDPKRVAWIHIPKCGSSFANVIISWACPDVPDDKLVDVPWIDAVWQDMKKNLGGECVKKLDLGVGHQGIVPTGEHNAWSKSKGHFVGMFKKPEQRIISGFKYGRHGIGGKTIQLVPYAQRVAGCAVRMMTGRGCNAEDKMGPEDVKKAIRVVDEGFAFAGLSEEWDLSVCLFHTMFGGECRRREFRNINFAVYNKKPEEGFWNATSGRWDEGQLQGFRDTADGALYEHVSRVFDARLKHYGLDWDVCEQKCFKGMASK